MSLVFEQRRVRHGIAVLVASEDGGEIESETVDMVVGDPVAETFHNHVAHIGIVAVQRVATAAEVKVASIGSQHIIGLVVDTAIGDVRTSLVTLSSVVEHHVEHHLDAVGVQAFRRADGHRRAKVGSFQTHRTRG